MIVSVLGSNGMLSKAIVSYCNNFNIDLVIYGRSIPYDSQYIKFHNVDFVNEEIDYSELMKSNLIIYAAGAGIQSNEQQQPDIIHFMNVSFPISILNKLNELNYVGYVVTFGSYFEIGDNQENILFNEEMVVSSSNKVVNDYSVTKRLLTNFISSFRGSFTNYHYILPTIYGENESKHRLIPYTINSIRNNEDIKFTSGNQVRQYIYVDEIPHILFKSIVCKLNSGIYNISGSETLTVRQLVEIIYSKLGLVLSEDLFGKVTRVDSGMLNLQLDGSILKKKINFESSVKISEVIDKY